MTETATIDKAAAGDAARTLRQHGWQVKQHGLRWICKHASGEGLEVLDNAGLAAVARLVNAQPGMTVDEVIAAMEAAEYGTAPPPPPGSSPDNALPLVELVGALEDHAAEIKRLSAQWGLGLDDVLTRPAALPERFSAPIDLVAVGRYQPRTKFDAAKLDELAASIQEHGILNPLIVFVSERGQLELVAGERRLRAARQAGLAFVPVEVRSYTLRQVAEISAIDNLQRDDLTPIEEGVAYERLIADLKLSEAELARRLGKNRAYIQQRRAIAHAAPEVIQALDEGAITFSQARAIAQAAPGEVKAQKTALTKLAELNRQGKRTSEVEARAAAEKAVLAKAKKDLQALGWTIEEPYGYFLVWAPTEKPRQWTGAEMLEAIRTHKRPGSERPRGLSGAVLAEQIAVLSTRYKIGHSHEPWIGLSVGWNDAPTFYAPVELVDLVAPIEAENAALIARYAAHGWTLAPMRGSWAGSWEAKGSHGGTRNPHDWAAAVALIEQIEAGKIADEKPKGYEPTKYTCEVCKQKTTDYNHFEGQRLCNTCYKQAQKAAAQRAAQIRVTIAEHLTDWLHTASRDALQLVLHAMPGRGAESLFGKSYIGPEEHLRRIRTADRSTLATAIIDRLAYVADEHHAAPVCELLGAPALPIEAAAASAAASWEDGPLAGLWHNLNRVTGWIDRARSEPPTLAAIEGNRDNLARLAENLEELSDDPDLPDEDYEALAQAIGDAELRLDQLAEVGAAPTLAEVGG